MTQAEFTRRAQAVFDGYVARLRARLAEKICELVNDSPKKGQTRAVTARRGAAESKSARRSPRRPGRARVAAPLRAQARVASSAAAAPAPPAPLATSTDPSPSTDHPATYGVGSDGHRLDSTPPKADVELAPVAARGAELGRVVVASGKVHRCGRCGGTGHNRRTCPADAPAESEPSSPTASADPPELGAGAEQDDEGLELDQVDDDVDAGAEVLDAPAAPAPRPVVDPGLTRPRRAPVPAGAAVSAARLPARPNPVLDALDAVDAAYRAGAPVDSSTCRRTDCSNEALHHEGPDCRLRVRGPELQIDRRRSLATQHARRLIAAGAETAAVVDATGIDRRTVYQLRRELAGAVP